MLGLVRTVLIDAGLGFLNWLTESRKFNLILMFITKILQSFFFLHNRFLQVAVWLFCKIIGNNLVISLNLILLWLNSDWTAVKSLRSIINSYRVYLHHYFWLLNYSWLVLRKWITFWPNINSRLILFLR